DRDDGGPQVADDRTEHRAGRRNKDGGRPPVPECRGEVPPRTQADGGALSEADRADDRGADQGGEPGGAPVTSKRPGDRHPRIELDQRTERRQVSRRPWSEPEPTQTRR